MGNNEVTLAIPFIPEPVNRQPRAGVEDMELVRQFGGDLIVDLHFCTTSPVAANLVR